MVKKSYSRTSVSKKPSKIQRAKRFLRSKVKYIPAAIAGTALLYLMHQVHNLKPIDYKLLRFNLITGSNVYKELGIKKGSSLDDVKKKLRECYRQAHTDRSKSVSTRNKFQLCTDLRDYLRSQKVDV